MRIAAPAIRSWRNRAGGKKEPTKEETADQNPVVLGTTPRIIDDRGIGPTERPEQSVSAGGLRIAAINRRAKNSLRRTRPRNADREGVDRAGNNNSAKWNRY